MCSMLFCLFTFCYLYFFQADVLTITQHVISGGQTFYNPLVGAFLITITLKLLQMAVSSLVKLSKRGFALTYFPSFILLTIVSDVRPVGVDDVSLGNWLWAAPILLLIFAFVVMVIKRYEPYESEYRSTGPLSQQAWINLCLLLLFFLFVGLFSNTDKSFHQRAKVETLIDGRNYTAALSAVRAMPHSDSVTSMLTIYAVAREGHLGDSLFAYPLVGGSSVLRPGKVHSLLQPDSILLKVTHTSANYQLIGFLLDRNLSDFMRYLPQYYPVDNLRPRYYQEAYEIFALRKKGLKPKAPFRKGSYYEYYFAEI